MPSEIVMAKQSGIVFGVKWYPAGATTNAEHGVREITRCYKALEAMEAHGLPLLVHAETTQEGVDIFDREVVFIDRHLTPVVRQFPALRIVVEHVSTRYAAQFVKEASPWIGATITVHHLLLNRNAIFEGGLRPHHYCRPILKREQDRLALVEAATNGNTKFFLGTDSAPHLRQDKESACGCAGIYTAHAAIELYAAVFEQANALDRLEAFASFHGADFYGLPRNAEQITLVKQPWKIDASIKVGNDSLIPYGAGEIVPWQIEGQRKVDAPAS
jgi:dihydroorotase